MHAVGCVITVLTNEQFIYFSIIPWTLANLALELWEAPVISTNSEYITTPRHQGMCLDGYTDK